MAEEGRMYRQLSRKSPEKKKGRGRSVFYLTRVEAAVPLTTGRHDNPGGTCHMCVCV